MRRAADGYAKHSLTYIKIKLVTHHPKYIQRKLKRKLFTPSTHATRESET